MQAVEEVLQVLGQEGQQDVPCPTWHYQDQGQQAQPGSDQSRMLPLQEALVKCYDLRSDATTLCVCTLLKHVRSAVDWHHVMLPGYSLWQLGCFG